MFSATSRVEKGDNYVKLPYGRATLGVYLGMVAATGALLSVEGE